MSKFTLVTLILLMIASFLFAVVAIGLLWFIAFIEEILALPFAVLLSFVLLIGLGLIYDEYKNYKWK